MLLALFRYFLDYPLHLPLQRRVRCSFTSIRVNTLIILIKKNLLLKNQNWKTHIEHINNLLRSNKTRHLNKSLMPS